MVLKGHSAVVLLFPRPRFVRNLNRVSDLRVPSTKAVGGHGPGAAGAGALAAGLVLTSGTLPRGPPSPICRERPRTLPIPDSHRGVRPSGWVDHGHRQPRSVAAAYDGM